MKIRLSDIKTLTARILGYCETDTHLLSIINRAHERLVLAGNWKGTVARYRICTSDSCLTWPREIGTILAWAKCAHPGYLRNEWYEFLEWGPGVMQDTSIMTDTMIDRGSACAFDDVRGSDKKLQIYADVAEAATAEVILRFYDENGNYVRTQPAGSWINGELLVPVVGTYVTTTNFCAAGGLVEVIKTATNGTIRLYEYDTVNLTRKALGYYQPDELVPNYRRSTIPGLSLCAGDGDCTTSQVTVMAKLRHIDLADDDDVLLIEHIEAMKLACQAVDKEDKGLISESEVFFHGMVDERTGRRTVGAIPLLQQQLADYRGKGNTVPIRMGCPTIFGAGITRVR